MSNELFSEVVKTISLDFAQKTSPVTVFAKQGDNRTRIIHIQPLMNGVPMNIDTSFQYVAKFAAKKPDGHYVYNDSAKINDDGTITVTLTDQTLAAHGNAICCIMLETQSGDVLSSQNFTLIIEFSAGAYKNLASSDEIMGLDDKLAQVQALIDKLEAEIKVLPPITPEDKDKVLTANEDGTAGWKDPKGGLSVTEITSPEEITADSPDGLYIQEGGSSGGNGGSTTIHYYNSLGEVPADLPEGSFVAVPSEGAGGGGLPVVELTTVIRESPDGSNPTFFSAEESQKLEAAFNGGMPPVMKFSILAEDDSEQSIITTASIMADMIVFSAVGFHFMFMPVEDNLWCGMIGRAE